LLSADSLRFSYPRSQARAPVVDDVSLSIDRGSVVAVLGPNGSGKTTLLKLLAGVLRPASGVVRLEGADIAGMSRAAIARRIAVVPQETHPAFEYTVLEMVLMGRYPHLRPFQIEGPGDIRLAQQALAATGTAALESRGFDTISGGEKQRVVVAVALAQAADVLLLDEPTASLDLAYQLEIAALVRRLNRERGVTMVLSTHDLNLAAAVSDRVVLLQGGRTLAMGATADVLTPENIARTFEVEVEVALHARAGHLVVIPLQRQRGGRSCERDGSREAGSHGSHEPAGLQPCSRGRR
jgi:iron complex transport system ATP-binding protein